MNLLFRWSAVHIIYCLSNLNPVVWAAQVSKQRAQIIKEKAPTDTYWWIEANCMKTIDANYVEKLLWNPLNDKFSSIDNEDLINPGSVVGLCNWDNQQQHLASSEK